VLQVACSVAILEKVGTVTNKDRSSDYSYCSLLVVNYLIVVACVIFRDPAHQYSQLERHHRILIERHNRILIELHARCRVSNHLYGLLSCPFSNSNLWSFGSEEEQLQDDDEKTTTT